MDLLAHSHLSLLVLSWLLADALMQVLIHLSRRFGWFDRPGGHKTHRDPTPVLGGVGIYVALVSSLALTVSISAGVPRPVLGILVGATLVTVLGAIDDFRPINAVIKLCVLTTATLVISRFGVCASVFPGGPENPLNLAVTLLWIVGVTSATNSLDHYNGTTAGSVAIACGTVTILAWGNWSDPVHSWLSYLSLALAGSCAGFLRHNLNGGKIFLGDNGSFLLGFLMAANLLFANWTADPLKALILPPLILTVPLYDITLSTILRVKDGVVGSVREAIVYCGKDHLAHRLRALGFGDRLTVVAIYSLGMVGGTFAIAIRGLDSRLAYLTLLAAYLILLTVLGLVLDRAPVHGKKAGAVRGAGSREGTPPPKPGGTPAEPPGREPDEAAAFPADPHPGMTRRSRPRVPTA